jgi:hypothetical protein
VCLCKFLDPFFPTMIDLLDTVTAHLESGHLDDTDTIGGVALQTIPDDICALCLMVRARVCEARAYAPEYLTRVHNPDHAHLHVEIAVAHRGVGADRAAVSTTPRPLVLRINPSEPLSNACQRCVSWRQLLQSAGTPARLKPNRDVRVGVGAEVLTTLEQAWRDRINREIDSERFSEAEMMFLGDDCHTLNALDPEQSRRGTFWIGDVRTPIVTDRKFQKSRTCARESSTRH